LLRGRDAPIFRGTVYVTTSGELVALAEVDRGEIIPKARVQPRRPEGQAPANDKVIDDVAYDQPQG